MATISHDDYLKGLGLLMLGREHSRKSLEFAEALARLLSEERDGHAFDAVFGDDSATLATVMEKLGIEVEPADD